MALPAAPVEEEQAILVAMGRTLAEMAALAEAVQHHATETKETFQRLEADWRRRQVMAAAGASQAAVVKGGEAEASFCDQHTSRLAAHVQRGVTPFLLEFVVARCLMML